MLRLIDIRFQLRQIRRKSKGGERVSHLAALFPRLTAYEALFLLRHLVAEANKSYTTSFTLLLREIHPLLNIGSDAARDKLSSAWIREIVYYISRTQSSRPERDLLKTLLASDCGQSVGQWVSQAIADAVSRENLKRFREFREYIAPDTLDRLSIRLGRYAHIRSYEQGIAYIDHVTIVRRRDLERNIDRLLEMGSISQDQASHLTLLLGARYAINRLKGCSEPEIQGKVILDFLGQAPSYDNISFLIRHLNSAMVERYNGRFTELIDKLIEADGASRIYIEPTAIKLWTTILVPYIAHVRDTDSETALVRKIITRYGTEDLIEHIRLEIARAGGGRPSARIADLQAFLRDLAESEHFREGTARIEEEIRKRAEGIARDRGEPVAIPDTKADRALADVVAKSLEEILREETSSFSVPWEMIRNRLEILEEKHPTADMDRAIQLSGYKEELDRRRAAGQADAMRDYLMQKPDYGIWDYQEQFYRATSQIGNLSIWEEDE